MSEDSGGNINMTLLSDGSVALICVTLTIILFNGEPDLMDAIVKWLSNAE